MPFLHKEMAVMPAYIIEYLAQRSSHKRTGDYRLAIGQNCFAKLCILVCEIRIASVMLEAKIRSFAG
jgi:hypothetical protein